MMMAGVIHLIIGMVAEVAIATGRNTTVAHCVRRHHWGSEMNEDFLEMVAYPSDSNTNADTTNESEEVDEGTSSDAQVVKGYDNGSEESDEDTSSDVQLGYGNDWNADSSDDPDSIDTINDNEDTSSDAQFIKGYDGTDLDSSDESDPSPSGDSSSDTDDTQTEEASFVALSRSYYHHQQRCLRCLRQQQQQHPAAQQQPINCHSICGGSDIQDITLMYTDDEDTSSDARITGYNDVVSSLYPDGPTPASSDSSDTDDDTQTKEASFVAVSGGYYHHQHPAAQQQQQQHMSCLECRMNQYRLGSSRANAVTNCLPFCGGTLM